MRSNLGANLKLLMMKSQLGSLVEKEEISFCGPSSRDISQSVCCLETAAFEIQNNYFYLTNDSQSKNQGWIVETLERSSLQGHNYVLREITDTYTGTKVPPKVNPIIKGLFLNHTQK